VQQRILAPTRAEEIPVALAPNKRLRLALRAYNFYCIWHLWSEWLACRAVLARAANGETWRRNTFPFVRWK
jgi:hypothetical protein